MTDAEWNEAQEMSDLYCGGNNCEPATPTVMPTGMGKIEEAK